MAFGDHDNTPPAALFQVNLADMTQQQPDPNQPAIDLKGTFERLTGGQPGQRIDLSAVIAAKVGTPELLDRASMAGNLMQQGVGQRVDLSDNAQSTRGMSDVAALGSQTAQLGIQVGKEAFKMGGELIGRIFGGGDDPKQKQEDAALAEIEHDLQARRAPAPQLHLGVSATSGPSGMG